LQRLQSSYAVLFVDDDPSERSTIAGALRCSHFDVTHVASPEEAALVAKDVSFAVGLVRVWAGAEGNGHEQSGLRAIDAIRQILPDCQILVLLEPKAGLETCRQAVLLGASGIVEARKCQPPEGLEQRLREAFQRYEATRRESQEIHRRAIFDEAGFAGQSREMAKVLLQARRAAMISDAPILIEGESGTGKQLLAEAIHRMDPKRRGRPFLVVNCSAITGTLAESALFGHRRGAFTGATEERAGYFRAANGGTILLDEIGELDKLLQPKLLRVLQAGTVLPVGADREESVDVRVIAASNRALVALVAEDRFRLDLYQRLNVIYLVIPPLRQRAEDIPLLFDYFLRKYHYYYRSPITGVDRRVYEVLGQNVGSGNVRELENIARQVLAFKREGERVELSDLPEALLKPAASATPEHVAPEIVESVRRALRGGQATLGKLLAECERVILAEAVRQQGGSRSRAARSLGITRRTLYNKFRKYQF
jgi:DNA-binding NtrC family response regulator